MSGTGTVPVRRWANFSPDAVDVCTVSQSISLLLQDDACYNAVQHWSRPEPHIETMHATMPFSTGAGPGHTDCTTDTGGVQSIDIEPLGDIPHRRSVPLPGRVAWTGNLVKCQPCGRGCLPSIWYLVRTLVLMIAVSYVVLAMHGDDSTYHHHRR
jgi:hypothetical protein